MFAQQVRSRVFFIQYEADILKESDMLGSRKLHICPKVTKMGSRGSERPGAHTQQKLTQVSPAPPPGLVPRHNYKLLMFSNRFMVNLKPQNVAQRRFVFVDSVTVFNIMRNYGEAFSTF